MFPESLNYFKILLRFVVKTKKEGSLSDNCVTIPARHGKLRTILCGQRSAQVREFKASNHALITQSGVINQTWNPVSLELKDTEVRAYRTDPVQVRSCPSNSCFSLKYHLLWFNVQGFPTILAFGADKDSRVTYEGARTASAIEPYSREQLEINVGPAQVSELTGPDVMEEKCGSAAIYFVSFLPDILD
ncbi:hypothetical protein V6N13_067900 [Hibiscus sabdariffa]|uniref:Uncharacterized protein n=1 Tax=Hibiscus sabdariffa TaxID=183260 RepID=A0ABR2DY65_9ROSI